jgi:hypothetical protein
MFGGLAEPGEHDIHIDESYKPAAKMFERCQKFLPGLDKIDIMTRPSMSTSASAPTALRTSISNRVRLQRRAQLRHGESRFTLSWVCAYDVLEPLDGMQEASFYSVTLARSANGGARSSGGLPMAMVRCRSVTHPKSSRSTADLQTTAGVCRAPWRGVYGSDLDLERDMA